MGSAAAAVVTVVDSWGSAVRVKGVQGVGKLGAQSLTKGRLRESNDFNYMPRRVMSCQR